MTNKPTSKQAAWVSPPQREYEQDGQRKFYAVVQFSERLKGLVTEAILDVWDRGQG